MANQTAHPRPVQVYYTRGHPSCSTVHVRTAATVVTVVSSSSAAIIATVRIITIIVTLATVISTYTDMNMNARNCQPLAQPIANPISRPFTSRKHTSTLPYMACTYHRRRHHRRRLLLLRRHHLLLQHHQRRLLRHHRHRLQSKIEQGHPIHNQSQHTSSTTGTKERQYKRYKMEPHLTTRTIVTIVYKRRLR